jgi:endonuclease/exonuclease/phosphatase family metal-dependent hydrolase
MPAKKTSTFPKRGTSMISYSALADGPDDARTATGLLRLKTALKNQIPAKLVDGNLLLATWNLRELGGTKGGGRSEEALHYIAEIVSAFDAVAIQEIRDDVAPFRRVMELLGPWWKFLVTDITVGRQGNQERIGFVYDSRKITFGGLASQVVLPPTPGGPAEQLARTPFFIAMKQGWFKFVICAAHIYYGTASATDERRIREIEELATYLRARAEDPNAWSENAILLGDFNIFDVEDETFKKLTNAGFTVPEKLLTSTSNALRNKHYDQIAFLAPYLSSKLDRFQAGVLDVFKVVFRDDEEALYKPMMKGRLSYAQWRTYQMSDHFPMWIELDTDFSRGFLANRMRGKPRVEEADRLKKPAKKRRARKGSVVPKRAARRPAKGARGERR